MIGFFYTGKTKFRILYVGSFNYRFNFLVVVIFRYFFFLTTVLVDSVFLDTCSLPLNFHNFVHRIIFVTFFLFSVESVIFFSIFNIFEQTYQKVIYFTLSFSKNKLLFYQFSVLNIFFFH